MWPGNGVVRADRGQTACHLGIQGCRKTGFYRVAAADQAKICRIDRQCIDVYQAFIGAGLSRRGIVDAVDHVPGWAKAGILIGFSNRHIVLLRS